MIMHKVTCLLSERACLNFVRASLLKFCVEVFRRVLCSSCVLCSSSMVCCVHVILGCSNTMQAAASKLVLQ